MDFFVYVGKGQPEKWDQFDEEGNIFHLQTNTTRPACLVVFDFPIVLFRLFEVEFYL